MSSKSNIQLFQIQGDITKTSDLSELEKLLKIEKNVNTSRFKNVITQIETPRGPGQSKDSVEELEREDFSEPSNTKGMEKGFDECNDDIPDKFDFMNIQKDGDCDQSFDEKSSEQCMSDESPTDPILDALNAFLHKLRNLTRGEVKDTNNQSLAESFRQAYSGFLDHLKNLTSDERALEQIHDMQRQIKEHLPSRSDFKSGIDCVLLLLVPELQDNNATINTCKPETSVSTTYVPTTDEQVKNGFCCRIIQVALAIFMICLLFFLSLVLFISIFLLDDTVTAVQIF